MREEYPFVEDLRPVISALKEGKEGGRTKVWRIFRAFYYLEKRLGRKSVARSNGRLLEIVDKNKRLL